MSQHELCHELFIEVIPTNRHVGDGRNDGEARNRENREDAEEGNKEEFRWNRLEQIPLRRGSLGPREQCEDAGAVKEGRRVQREQKKARKRRGGEG
eukprot:753813-Hanusia_phi.AAC.6